jgi:hypothetical protein
LTIFRGVLNKYPKSISFMRILNIFRIEEIRPFWWLWWKTGLQYQFSWFTIQDLSVNIKRTPHRKQLPCGVQVADGVQLMLAAHPTGKGRRARESPVSRRLYAAV